MLRIVLSLAFAVLLAPYGAPRAQEFRPGDEGAAAPRDAPQEMDSPEQRRTHAITVCEQSVAGQLENSGFVNWPTRSQYKVRERGGGEFDIEGYVDTPNPVGDVRQSWTCHATARGGQWSGYAQLNKETAPAKPVRESPTQEREMREPAMREPSMPEPPGREPPPSSLASKKLPDNMGNCRSVTFRETYAEKHAAEGFQIVKGTIENSGARPIWNVKVCAAATCTMVHGEFPPMERGATKEFAFKVQTLDVVTVTALCAMVTEPM